MGAWPPSAWRWRCVAWESPAAGRRWPNRHACPRGVLWWACLTLATGCAGRCFVGQRFRGFGLAVTLGFAGGDGLGVGSFSVLIGVGGSGCRRRRGAASFKIHARLVWPVFCPDSARLDPAPGLDGGDVGHGGDDAIGAARWWARLTRGYQPPPAPSAAEGVGAARHPHRWRWPTRSHLLLHLGFFTCGFHIAFWSPPARRVNLCGLPLPVASWSPAIIGLSNIVGSLYAGRAYALPQQICAGGDVWLARAADCALLDGPGHRLDLPCLPPAWGLTWLATVPPTAAIIGKLFGVRYLARCLA